MVSFSKKTTRRRQYHQSKLNLGCFFKMWSFFKKTTRRRQYHQSIPIYSYIILYNPISSGPDSKKNDRLGHAGLVTDWIIQSGNLAQSGQIAFDYTDTCTYSSQKSHSPRVGCDTSLRHQAYPRKI